MTPGPQVTAGLRFYRGLVAAGQIDASRFATHHFALGDMLEAYDVFGRAADTGAVKVVLSR